MTGEKIKQVFQAHLLFVSILMMGAFFRIAGEGDIDGNTFLFASILAIGVIMALSFFNQFVLDLCNDLNSKWTVINYLIPGILLGGMILVFRVPVPLVDVILVVILFSIANLLMYSITKSPDGSRKS